MPRLHRSIALALLVLTTTVAAFAAAATDPVWITASGKGKKYHRHDCTTLGHSAQLVKLTRSDAEKRGLTPCKVCKP